GSAADLIKIAMIRLHHKLKKLNLKSMMISQVHDELIFEVAPRELDLLKETVRFEMENAAELTIPLRVDIGVGPSWYEAH
ncbi:MAG: hypothetical protein KAI81_07915, partial [Candidatus Marinimicrobia bacterium]|nr:hypothetical protein [Candidatus Neomarinimicrobiota bacterium]